MKLVLTSSSGETIKEMPIKATNFDEITTSPEALAGLMMDCVYCEDCPVTDRSVCKYKYENCKEAWVEWLKQESDTE